MKDFKDFPNFSFLSKMILNTRKIIKAFIAAVCIVLDGNSLLGKIIGHIDVKIFRYIKLKFF